MSKTTSDLNGWQSSFTRFLKCDERLANFRQKKLSFGNKFLDMACGGILPDDLVLIGAPSGVGKTSFVTNIAKENVLLGKKVHVIALEAYTGEIEDRIHYSVVAQKYYEDKNTHGHLSFRGWIDGQYDDQLRKYRTAVGVEMTKLENMYTFYRTKDFTIQDFLEQSFKIKDNTDLIILDHVHYFDFEDENENRAIKYIVKKIRTFIQETGIPVVMVGHLRKTQKFSNELVAGIDEFHGSSDLTKIATKVISIGRGEMVDKHRASTFMRVPKMRIDGSVTFYVAKLLFDFRTNTYAKEIKLGILECGGKEFAELDPTRYPDWYHD